MDIDVLGLGAEEIPAASFFGTRAAVAVCGSRWRVSARCLRRAHRWAKIAEPASHAGARPGQRRRPTGAPRSPAQRRGAHRDAGSSSQPAHRGPTRSVRTRRGIPPGPGCARTAGQRQGSRRRVRTGPPCCSGFGAGRTTGAVDDGVVRRIVDDRSPRSSSWVCSDAVVRCWRCRCPTSAKPDRMSSAGDGGGDRGGRRLSLRHGQRGRHAAAGARVDEHPGAVLGGEGLATAPGSGAVQSAETPRSPVTDGASLR